MGEGQIIDRTKMHVFAYGSNMALFRIRDRVASAEVIDIGYLPRRRLAFHKSGQDGSAKANAFFTGVDTDQVWGVIYRISHRDHIVLDRLESVGSGYDREELDVQSGIGELPVFTYIARDEMIDDSLKPFSWYHKLVLHGAIEHALPDPYINALSKVDSIADPDEIRDQLHRDLIGIERE